MSVPLSLATISRTLHLPNKSLLANILTKDVLTPSTWWTKLLADWLVMAVSKPPIIKTFGEYAKTFAAALYKMGAIFQRIDVTFDCYRPESIKAGTKTKRNQGKYQYNVKSNVSHFRCHLSGAISWHSKITRQIWYCYCRTIWLIIALVIKQWLLLEDSPNLRSSSLQTRH